MHFYPIRGLHDEAVQACTRALAVLERAETREAELLTARLQAYQAVALQYLGQMPQARQLLQASMDCARRLGSEEDIAHALASLGSGAVFRGAAQEAMAYFQEALAIYEARGDYYGRVWVLQCLGWAALSIDDPALAQAYHHRSLPLLRQHGPPSLLGWTLYELGAIQRDSGAYDEAWAYLEEARATCEAIGYHFALLSCLLGLGQTAELTGQAGRAQHYYQEAVALRHHLGDVTDIATSLALLARVTLALGDAAQAERRLQELRVFSDRAATAIARGCYDYAAAEIAFHRNNLDAAKAGWQQSATNLRPTRRRSLAFLPLLRLGQLYLLTGDDEQAEAAFEDALQEAWSRSSLGQTLEAMMGLGQVQARQGHAERAADLAALVQHHPASPWMARQQAEGLLAELGQVLPEGALAAAVQRGRAQPLESAVAELLPDEYGG
jgi:tetratricopeptide (TPR) repeat protein